MNPIHAFTHLKGLKTLKRSKTCILMTFSETKLHESVLVSSIKEEETQPIILLIDNYKMTQSSNIQLKFEQYFFMSD